MTTRNIDLLIRARDGASRAFKEVSAALEELGSIQGNVAASGQKLDQSLTDSKGAATALSRQIGSQTAREAQKAQQVFERIEATVDKNTASLDRMGKELAESEARYAALQAEASAAEKAIVSAALAARRSGDASDQQRLEAAQRAYRDLNREIVRSGRSVADQADKFSRSEAELGRIANAARAATLALGEVRRESARAQGVADTRGSANSANEAARRGVAQLAAAEREVAREIADREAATARASEEYAQGTANAARGMAALSQAERRVEGDIRRRAAAQANANSRAGFGALAEAEQQVARSLRNSATAAAASERAYSRLNARLQEMRVRGRVTAEEQAKLAQSFRSALNAGRAYRPTLRQVARELAGLGPASMAAANGVRQVGTEMLNARRAFRAFYGDSRQALSLMQRLRGEVLSLTASFVGFYGIFQTGQGFLQSFQALEAAQNRLGAAFEQDYSQVAAELERLQGEAARLGISFDTLSGTFSKFLISGQQAGLETEQLRTIFRQVSEAGRVLKLSNDQLEGTFNALTQIAGKGTLQMEELRQQLGDRLPGAVGLVATALGFAEDELSDFYKAVENGQVGAEEALVALGRGLEQTYGGQLEDALDSVSTKIGELQNLFFQRQLTAANSGFIEGIEDAIEALNGFLDSREGIEFFESIGAAFQQLVQVLPVLLENMDLLVAAFQAFVAIKLGQVAAGFAANFARLGTATFAQRRVQVALNAAVAAFSPAAAGAMASATRFGVALRGLRAVVSGLIVTLRTALLAVGGWVGIAVAALTFFAFQGFGSVNDAAQENREQMRQVQEIVGQVGEAYRLAAGGTDKFASSLRKLPLLDMKVQLREAAAALAELREQTAQRNVIGANGLSRQFQDELVGGASDELFGTVISWVAAFEEGQIGARELLEGLRDIGRTSEELSSFDTLGPFLDQLEEMAEAEDKVARLEAEIAVIEGTATDAQRELLGLTESIEDAGEAADGTSAEMQTFLDAMRKLGENIPGVAAKLEELDQLAEIEADFKAAMEAANQFGDALERTQRKAEALNLRNDALRAFYDDSIRQFDGTDGTSVAAELLRDLEGFRATPYFDVNALRVGFGSDTVTLADGSVRSVVEGTRVTVEDANRDLFRRIETEFAPTVVRQIGAARFESLNAQQQAALISIAYNYGELPDRILAAAREGSAGQVASAIRGLAGDNDGVNANRRNREAALFETDAGVSNLNREFDRTRAQEAREAEQLANEQERALAAVQDRIDATARENELSQLRLIDREVEKALDEERNRLAEAGLELTAEQAAEIERVTRAKFQQAQLDEDRNASLERARKLEEEVTLLQEKRNLLQQEQENQRNAGELAGAEATGAEIAEVEAALDGAITKAIQFWEALGGEGSERAILGLQAVRQELNKVEAKALFSGEQINQMIASGLSGAVSAFAQAVANGENAWDAFRNAALQALADVLIQIGQAIVQQIILNALTGGGGAGGGFGGFVAGGLNAIVAHGGGVAGSSGPSSRSVNPAVFANAVRYHTGGIAGLAPNEVPAILQEGEEVLTEGDPRHRKNGGGADEGLTIINSFDAEEVMERALATPRGQRALVNAVRGSNTEVKAALG